MNEIGQEWKVLLQENPVKEQNLKLKVISDSLQDRMARHGSIIRPLEGLGSEIKIVSQFLKQLPEISILESTVDLIPYLRLKDALFSQLVILNSILEHHRVHGGSRGSYLMLRDECNGKMKIKPPGELEQYAFVLDDADKCDEILTIRLGHPTEGEKSMPIQTAWEKVRPIPREFGWFENVWKDFQDEKIYEGKE